MEKKSKKKSNKRSCESVYFVGVNKDAHKEYDWYHGYLPRADINTLLEKDGDFLVRVSQADGTGNEPSKTVLSVRWKGIIHHYLLVESPDGTIRMGPNKFDTVLDAINTLSIRRIPVTTEVGALLITPVFKQDWELRHDQIVLGKMLGEGAFGGVYMGHMTIKGNIIIPVAVKVNKENDKMSSKKMIEEVCKEARIMRKYQHPNVVNFYGVCVEREPIMLVMELADTGALDHYLKTESSVTLREKMKYAFDASKGLEYLHINGCIHRDVAARNCLLNSGTVKISDFGLSKQLSDHAHKYKLKDFQKKLPIRWLAPEVMTSATYTTKSDVFSFGILIWEIFMDGAIPYPDMTLGEVKQQVKAGYRMPPPDRMPTFMRNIMVNLCFTENPEERATMSDIRKRMEDVLERRMESYNTMKSAYLKI